MKFKHENMKYNIAEKYNKNGTKHFLTNTEDEKSSAVLSFWLTRPPSAYFIL